MQVVSREIALGLSDFKASSFCQGHLLASLPLLGWGLEKGKGRGTSGRVRKGVLILWAVCY